MKKMKMKTKEMKKNVLGFGCSGVPGCPGVLGCSGVPGFSTCPCRQHSQMRAVPTGFFT